MCLNSRSPAGKWEISMVDRVLFSSNNDRWTTPRDFFDKIDDILGPFDFDVCADAENTKVKDAYFTKEDDALARDWHLFGRRIWMNPPYGRDIGRWMRKAWEESRKGCTVVCLVITTLR